MKRQHQLYSFPNIKENWIHECVFSLFVTSYSQTITHFLTEKTWQHHAVQRKDTAWKLRCLALNHLQILKQKMDLSKEIVSQSSVKCQPIHIQTDNSFTMNTLFWICKSWKKVTEKKWKLIISFLSQFLMFLHFCQSWISNKQSVTKINRYWIFCWVSFKTRGSRLNSRHEVFKENWQMDRVKVCLDYESCLSLSLSFLILSHKINIRNLVMMAILWWF